MPHKHTNLGYSTLRVHTLPPPLSPNAREQDTQPSRLKQQKKTYTDSRQQTDAASPRRYLHLSTVLCRTHMPAQARAATPRKMPSQTAQRTSPFCTHLSFRCFPSPAGAPALSPPPPPNSGSSRSKTSYPLAPPRPAPPAPPLLLLVPPMTTPDSLSSASHPGPTLGCWRQGSRVSSKPSSSAMRRCCCCEEEEKEEEEEDEEEDEPPMLVLPLPLMVVRAAGGGGEIFALRRGDKDLSLLLQVLLLLLPLMVPPPLLLLLLLPVTAACLDPATPFLCMNKGPGGGRTSRSSAVASRSLFGCGVYYMGVYTT